MILNYGTVISPVYYTFSLVGNIIVFLRQVNEQSKEKYFIVLSTKGKCQFWREINTFPCPPSLKSRVFSILRQKMYVPNASEKDVKELISAPTH